MENKKENFSEWYSEIIDLAELSDRRYSIKGMNIWMPYGLKAIHAIDGVIRKALDSRGFSEVSFPLLIPRNQLEVEFEHFKGFEDQLFWVTRGGKDPLDVELALRPTSEVAMYPIFSLWIRSHANLPLKIYQIVNTYRHETKHTRPFIRVREIHFFEAHTAHESYEDAEKQLEEYDRTFVDISGKLLISYSRHRRPDWDKFPGARYSVAYDAIMPDGRVLQIGTIHQYGDNFSRTYGIEFTDEEGERKFVHQTTYGLSERLFAAIIAQHGDDKGLIFPPEIAPVQVVVVPIPPLGKGSFDFLSGVMEILSTYRVKLDDRDNYTPGYKYNDWEMRGVPFRIEIGMKEVQGNFVTLSRRTGGKRKIPVKNLRGEMEEEMKLMEETLIRRARDFTESRTISSNSMDQVRDFNGVATVYWCGSKDCADRIEEHTGKSCLGEIMGDTTTGACIVCGKEGRLASFARSF